MEPFPDLSNEDRQYCPWWVQDDFLSDDGDCSAGGGEEAGALRGGVGRGSSQVFKQRGEEEIGVGGRW